DSMVMDAVFWFGVQGYEGILATTWQRLCARSRRVIEIGGNVGLFSVLGGTAMTEWRYTVVEPLPELAGITRANRARNRIGRVEVLEAAAVPDSTGEVTLNVPNEGRQAPVGAYLASSSEIAPRSLNRTIKVRAVRFAELAQDADLIKIDAEGI